MVRLGLLYPKIQCPTHRVTNYIQGTGRCYKHSGGDSTPEDRLCCPGHHQKVPLAATHSYKLPIPGRPGLLCVISSTVLEQLAHPRMIPAGCCESTAGQSASSASLSPGGLGIPPFPGIPTAL